MCDRPVDAECSYLPRPDQLWPLRKVSEKIGLQLPYGTMTFTVGELDGVAIPLLFADVAAFAQHVD